MLCAIALPGGVLFAIKGQTMTKLLATGASKTPFMKLDWTDAKKSLIGLLIVLAGAALTWWEQSFESIDFGAYEAIAVAVNAFVVGLVKKLITDNTPPKRL